MPLCPVSTWPIIRRPILPHTISFIVWDSVKETLFWKNSEPSIGVPYWKTTGKRRDHATKNCWWPCLSKLKTQANIPNLRAKSWFKCSVRGLSQSSILTKVSLVQGFLPLVISYNIYSSFPIYSFLTNGKRKLDVACSVARLRGSLAGWGSCLEQRCSSWSLYLQHLTNITSNSTARYNGNQWEW